MFKGNVLKQIKDTDFLKITWDSKAKKVVKEAVKDLNAEINEQSNSRNAKIIGNLPEYLTFSQAERLFREIIRKTKEIEDKVKLVKVEVMHQEEGQKPSSSQEANAENVVLDDNFKMILIPLIEAVFTNQDQKFSLISYDDKYRYFANSLYQSYSESTGVSVDYLPILPTQEEVDLALNGKQKLNLGFNYRNDIEISDDNTNASETVMNEDQTETDVDDNVAAKVSAMDALTDTVDTGDLSDNSTGNYVNDSYNDYPQNDYSESDYSDQYQNNDYQEPQGNSDYVEYDDYSNSYQEAKQESNQRLIKFPDDTGMVLQGKQAQVLSPQGSVNNLTPIDLTGQKVIADFPLFEIKDFPKTSYAPYEDEYVAWKLNEAKKEFNDQLLKRSKVTEEFSIESIRQELKEFERAEINKINAEIEAKDNRKNLKELIRHETYQAELEERQHNDNQLAKEENKALDEEKRRYKSKVEEIKSNFEKRRHETKHEIHQKYLQEAQRRLQEEVIETTAYLEKMLQDKLMDLEQAKLAKQDDLIAENKDASRQIGQELYEQKKAKIKRLILALRKEHEVAKQEYLVKKAEELAKQEREDTLKTNAQLRERIGELENQSKKVQDNRLAMENRFLEEKRKAINDHADLYAKLQNPQPQVVEEKPVNPQTVKEPFNWGKTAVYGLVICILAGATGGVFYYQHHQNQVQASRMQELIESQKQTKAELQAQKDSIEAEKQKASDSSKQKEQAQSKEKIEELEKQLSSLKAQSSEAQSSSTQSSESK